MGWNASRLYQPLESDKTPRYGFSALIAECRLDYHGTPTVSMHDSGAGKAGRGRLNWTFVLGGDEQKDS